MFGIHNKVRCFAAVSKTSLTRHVWASSSTTNQRTSTLVSSPGIRAADIHVLHLDLTAAPFDLGAAIAEWRAEFGPRPEDAQDDPYAHVRDLSPERPFDWAE